MEAGMCKWMGWAVGVYWIFDAMLAERMRICSTIELLTQGMGII